MFRTMEIKHNFVDLTNSFFLLYSIFLIYCRILINKFLHHKNINRDKCLAREQEGGHVIQTQIRLFFL